MLHSGRGICTYVRISFQLLCTRRQSDEFVDQRKNFERGYAEHKIGRIAGNRASSSRCDKHRHYRLHQGVSFTFRFCKEFITNHLISLQGGSVDSILQFVRVPIVDRDTCSGQMKRRILDGEICAGFSTGGKDACQVQLFCTAAALPQVSCYRRGL